MVGMTKKRLILRIAAVIAIIIAIFLIAREAKAPEQTPPAGQGALPANNVPVVDPASIGKIIKEVGTGKEYMSNQVIVEFIPNESEADALAIIASVDGKMLQRFTKAPLFLIQVIDKGDGSGARKAVEKLKTNSSVKSAGLNYLTTIDTTKTP